MQLFFYCKENYQIPKSYPTIARKKIKNVKQIKIKIYLC